MKYRKPFGFLTCVILLIGSMLACNFPVMVSQTETGEPNLTLTALYAEEQIPTSTEPSIATMTMTLHPTVTATATATATTAPTNTESPPTATQTPTNTTTPSSAPSRPSTKIIAEYISSSPDIDGEWGDWETTAYPMKNVVYGAGNWTGEEDLEGSYKIAWDYSYLYVAVKVIDDVYKQGAKGYDIYKGDSLEILLDTNLYGDFYYNVLSPDDYQLGISGGRPDVYGEREAYLWFPTSLAGTKTKVKIGSVQSEGVYRVEAAIPWNVFGVDPYDGLRMGFAISVSDNDDTSQNIQQTMISNVSNRHLTQPMTWGELVLD